MQNNFLIGEGNKSFSSNVISQYSLHCWEFQSSSKINKKQITVLTLSWKTLKSVAFRISGTVLFTYKTRTNENQNSQNKKPQGHLSKCHEVLTNQKYLTRPNFEISAFLFRKLKQNLIMS